MQPHCACVRLCFFFPTGTLINIVSPALLACLLARVKSMELAFQSALQGMAWRKRALKDHPRSLTLSRAARAISLRFHLSIHTILYFIFSLFFLGLVFYLLMIISYLLPPLIDMYISWGPFCETGYLWGCESEATSKVISLVIYLRS